MPKTDVRKSAVKTHAKSEIARLKHKACRSGILTQEKKLRTAIETGDSAAAELLKEEYSVLDKAVKYGSIHKNTANRKKARLAAALAKGVKKPAAEEKKAE